ncbi:hypothetical protein AVEN_231066-1 [Araneus ventricosus]|uniref:RNase H type-1 domain-containing protein n=1 Tax=Araneus ventricosus TaxID=182803 RepID=A0A4Y2A4K6_ARAVE|nr:hypothetical protein AVEN_231066-1 [Araneus ventricosus]
MLWSWISCLIRQRAERPDKDTPLHLTTRSEYHKFQIWICRSTEAGEVLEVGELDYNKNSTNIPLNLKTLKINQRIPNSQFEVYTEDSRIDDNIGLSMCIFPKDETPDIYRFKLNKNNTFFQAKLAVIDFGVRWALENHKSINIHTYSRSSIEALKSARPRSAIVISVKKNFYMAGDLVGHAKLANLEG